MPMFPIPILPSIHNIKFVETGKPNKGARLGVPYGAVGDGRSRLLLAEALNALGGRHFCCLMLLSRGWSDSGG